MRRTIFVSGHCVAELSKEPFAGGAHLQGQFGSLLTLGAYP